jgi:predicted TIM-barrel fold metal-dependent hydrolase
MIDGLAVVDAHMHVPRLSTVSPAWLQWAADYGKDSGWRDVFGPEGDPDPARLDAVLDKEGVDAALLFAEYSPQATGIQPAEDLLPIIAYHPARFRLVANVNPHLHQPPAAEAARQLDLGAVAVKVHPVHGGFRPDTPGMYQVYELCAERRVPVIVHTGPSIFPGSQPEAGDPALMDPIAADFPGVTFVLAHGGRGGTYAPAARMALARDNVWLDLAGLPPKRLPGYYAGFDLPLLARKWIFGTDWPGVPGVAANARAIAALGLPDDTLAAVLAGNAARVYPGITIPEARGDLDSLSRTSRGSPPAPPALQVAASRVSRARPAPRRTPPRPRPDPRACARRTAAS